MAKETILLVQVELIESSAVDPGTNMTKGRNEKNEKHATKKQKKSIKTVPSECERVIEERRQNKKPKNWRIKLEVYSSLNLFDYTNSLFTPGVKQWIEKE